MDLPHYEGLGGDCLFLDMFVVYLGKISISPITGEPELYYPRMYRLIKYVGSAIVTGSIICVAFVLMMMSLNLQGYVHEANSLFYFYELSQFSSPGRSECPAAAEGLLTCRFPT